MKLRLSLIGSVFAIILVLANVAWGQNANPAPKLAIKETTINLGDIKMGEIAKHVFIVRNEGDADLEIKNIAPSCGCETVNFDRTIPPGKEGKITLQVRTTGYNGPITKSAIVTTNDPQRLSFDISLQMVVNGERLMGQTIGPFIVSPTTEVSVTNIVGTASNFLITIYSTGTPAPKISRVIPSDGPFKITLEAAPDGSRYLVKGVNAATLPIGRHVQSVKLATESKERPEITLQFQADVMPPLRLTPDKISFDRVSVTADGEPPSSSKFIWIVQGGGPALEIKKISSTLPFITAEIQSQEVGRTYILRAKFSAPPPKGDHAGKIIIETNNPHQPTLEVAVTVKVS